MIPVQLAAGAQDFADGGGQIMFGLSARWAGRLGEHTRDARRSC
jgi:hypothetical protein